MAWLLPDWKERGLPWLSWQSYLLFVCTTGTLSVYCYKAGAGQFHSGQKPFPITTSNITISLDFNADTVGNICWVVWFLAHIQVYLEVKFGFTWNWVLCNDHIIDSTCSWQEEKGTSCRSWKVYIFINSRLCFHYSGVDAGIKSLLEGVSAYSATHDHGANIITSKAYARSILDPYYKKTCSDLGLKYGFQKSVLLLDCWWGWFDHYFQEWFGAEYHWVLKVIASCAAKMYTCRSAWWCWHYCCAKRWAMKSRLNCKLITRVQVVSGSFMECVCLLSLKIRSRRTRTLDSDQSDSSYEVQTYRMDW